MSFENGRVVRVVMRVSQGPFEVVNVLHYDLNDGSIPGESNNPQTLADFFRDNVIGRLDVLFTQAWTIHPVLVEDEIDPLDRFAPRSAWQSGVDHVGTRPLAGDALPPGLVVLCTLKSNTVGRRYNGRMWVGGQFNEADQVGGTWNAALLTDVGNFIGAIPHQPDLAGGAGTAQADWSIYSRTARQQNQSHYLAHGIAPIVRTDVHWLRSRSKFRT